MVVPCFLLVDVTDQLLPGPDAFDSLAITDFTVELKGEANPFSVEMLLLGYFSTSAGEGTKILGMPAHECLCVCRCTCVLGRCEHV